MADCVYNVNDHIKRIKLEEARQADWQTRADEYSRAIALLEQAATTEETK